MLCMHNAINTFFLPRHPRNIKDKASSKDKKSSKSKKSEKDTSKSKKDKCKSEKDKSKKSETKTEDHSASDREVQPKAKAAAKKGSRKPVIPPEETAAKQAKKKSSHEGFLYLIPWFDSERRLKWHGLGLKSVWLLCPCVVYKCLHASWYAALPEVYGNQLHFQNLRKA